MAQTKKNIKIILIAILVAITMLAILYFIDIDRMRNNKEVLFSTWGFDYAPPINLQYEEITIAIENYLVEKGDSENKKYDNEKSFVSFKTYLIEEKEVFTKFNIYAWVLQESYYYENNETKQNSGSSIPHKFVVEKQDDKYVVTSAIIPRDGSYYVEDMKKIFPTSVRKDMEKVHQDGTIEKLQLEIEKQVKLYFHK